MNRSIAKAASIKALDLAFMSTLFSSAFMLVMVFITSNAYANITALVADTKVSGFMKAVFGIAALFLVWDFLQKLFKGDDGLIKQGLITVFAIYLATSYDTFLTNILNLSV